MSDGVLPKIAKTVPRLGSPFDGEKLATAAAIERLLKASKLDWNDLAAHIASRPLAVPSETPRLSYTPRINGNPVSRDEATSKVRALLADGMSGSGIASALNVSNEFIVWAMHGCEWEGPANGNAAPSW